MAENVGANLNVTQTATPPAKRPPHAPPVRVQLSITGKEGQEQREVIRKVTKAHEVVEVDGFVFKRKRRTLPGDSIGCEEPAKRARGDTNTASGACSSGEASVQPAVPAPPHAEAVEAPEPSEAEGAVREPIEAPPQQQQQQQRLPGVDAQQAAQAALAALPAAGDVPEAERLLALCSRLAEDEAAAAGGAPGGAALRQLLGSFLGDVRAALGDGMLQPGEDAAAAAAAQEAALLAELAGQRDSLAVRLARFQQEEAQWNELLAASAAEEQAAGEAPAADAQQGAVRPVEGEAAAAADAQGTAGQQAGGEAAAQAAEGAEALGGDKAGAAGAPAVAAPGVLQQAKLDAHRTLTLQVEGLCALVEGVQELVARAEQVTSAEFDKLYKRSFASVPGLNSPARLIREIARPPLSRLQQGAGADPAASA